MALIKSTSRTTGGSSSLHTSKPANSRRIVGAGPGAVAALYAQVLSYMKNRRIRLLDLFGMLANEKKLITVTSLQKSLPTIGVNSTKEAIIYFVRTLEGPNLTVPYGLFAQGLANHRMASRQVVTAKSASSNRHQSSGRSSSAPGHGRKTKTKLQKIKKGVETEVQRRRSLAHELGTLKLEKVEDEITNAVHGSTAKIAHKVSTDLQQHVQQFLQDTDQNEAMYDRLCDFAESRGSDHDVTERSAILQTRVRSALRLGKVAVAIKKRHMQLTCKQIELAKLLGRSVQGLFSGSVDHNSHVSLQTFNPSADRDIARQMDTIQRDVLKWCNDPSLA